MKKLSLWLNIILIVAVAGLYFLHFTGKKSTKVEKTTATDGNEQGVNVDVKFAYVDIDTLVANYNMFIDKKAALEQKKSESEAELNQKSKELDNQIQKYKSDYSKGLITRTKAQMVEQELGKKQQDLYDRGQYLQRELMDEEQVMYRQVLNEVMNYLVDYNKDYNYKFIFSNTFGGQILYADKGLNITQEVLNGINEKYDKTKK